MSAQKARLVGIDATRTIAILGVIVAHCVSMDPGDGFGVDVQAVLSHIVRWAVPFYFMVAGYFLVRKIEAPWQTIWGLALRLLPVFLFWAVLYEILYGDIHGVFEGPVSVVNFLLMPEAGYHMWFLPSLGVSAALVLVIAHYGSLNMALGVAAVFFVMAVLMTSYAFVVCENEYSVCWNMRKGPFYGMVFVALGACAARGSVPVLSSRAAIALIIFGAGLRLAEAAWLDANGHIWFSDYEIGFGALPLAFGIFCLALNFEGQGRFARGLASLGPYVLGVYASHALFIYVLSGALPKWFQVETVGVLMVAMMVSALCIALTLLGSRVPVVRALFR